jgi:hypothetical protein
MGTVRGQSNPHTGQRPEQQYGEERGRHNAGTRRQVVRRVRTGRHGPGAVSCRSSKHHSDHRCDVYDATPGFCGSSRGCGQAPGCRRADRDLKDDAQDGRRRNHHGRKHRYHCNGHRCMPHKTAVGPNSSLRERNQRTRYAYGSGDDVNSHGAPRSVADGRISLSPISEWPEICLRDTLFVDKTRTPSDRAKGMDDSSPQVEQCCFVHRLEPDYATCAASSAIGNSFTERVDVQRRMLHFRNGSRHILRCIHTSLSLLGWPSVVRIVSRIEMVTWVIPRTFGGAGCDRVARPLLAGSEQFLPSWPPTNEVDHE